MICLDVLGPWWDVETEDEDGNTYRDERRCPQFLFDIADDMPWQDVTGQASENIAPSPNLCVWRVWPTEEKSALLATDGRYEVLRQGEVSREFTVPAGW